jgi:hypothetical protein
MTYFGQVKHLYIGCRVRIDKTGEVRILVGCVKESLHLKKQNTPFVDKFYIHDVTPILRPLSDIALYEVEHYRHLQNMPDIPTEIRTHGLTPSAFHYLLSRGFDLFDLIQNGEAADSTKVDRDNYVNHKLAGMQGFNL